MRLRFGWGPLLAIRRDLLASHVVHLQAEVMAESVRQESPCQAPVPGFLRRDLEYSEVAQDLAHAPTGTR